MERYIFNPGNGKDYYLFYSDYTSRTSDNQEFFISWVQGNRGTSFVGNKHDILKANFFSDKMNIFEDDANAILFFLNDCKKIDVDIRPYSYDGTMYLSKLDYNGYTFKLNTDSEVLGD
tara:strand:+ start:1393 stop:1746 length:354 start_codon:yes stop_codon:yes gene_type:complete